MLAVVVLLLLLPVEVTGIMTEGVHDAAAAVGVLKGTTVLRWASARRRAMAACKCSFK
jgi:hypothetical protein